MLREKTNSWVSICTPNDAHNIAHRTPVCGDLFFSILSDCESYASGDFRCGGDDPAQMERAFGTEATCNTCISKQQIFSEYIGATEVERASGRNCVLETTQYS
jgi:hypothetical protein